MAERKLKLDVSKRLKFTKSAKVMRETASMGSTVKWAGRATLATGGVLTGMGMPLIGLPLMVSGSLFASAASTGQRKAENRLGVLKRGAARKRASIKSLKRKAVQRTITKRKSSAAKGKKSDGVRDAYTTKSGKYVPAKALTAKQRRPRRR
jgi:hypothetical protein